MIVLYFIIISIFFQFSECSNDQRYLLIRVIGGNQGIEFYRKVALKSRDDSEISPAKIREDISSNEIFHHLIQRVEDIESWFEDKGWNNLVQDKTDQDTFVSFTGSTQVMKSWKLYLKHRLTVFVRVPARVMGEMILTKRIFEMPKVVLFGLGAPNIFGADFLQRQWEFIILDRAEHIGTAKIYIDHVPTPRDRKTSIYPRFLYGSNFPDNRTFFSVEEIQHHRAARLWLEKPEHMEDDENIKFKWDSFLRYIKCCCGSECFANKKIALRALQVVGITRSKGCSIIVPNGDYDISGIFRLFTLEEGALSRLKLYVGDGLIITYERDDPTVVSGGRQLTKTILQGLCEVQHASIQFDHIPTWVKQILDDKGINFFEGVYID